MPKPTTSQKAAFKRLQDVDPNVEVRWDEKTGAPARVRGALSGPQAGDPDAIARQFLAASKDMFAMKAPEEELQLKAVGTDMRGNRHVRYQQMYKGLAVFGGEMVVRMTGENAIRGVSGKFAPRIDLPTEPEVPAEDARKTMLEHAPDNKARPGEEPLLLVLVREGKPYLAWHMTVYGKDVALDGSEMPARWEYFVHALSGKIIWHYNSLPTHTQTTGTGTGKYAGVVTLNTVHDHASDKYQLEDRWMPSTARIYTHDADGFLDDIFYTCPPKPVSEDGDNNWSAASQGAEVDCHEYTRMVFDYFLVMHGRDSYDGAGADMHIHAHVGNNFNNAFWNGSCVQIGDGDAVDYDAFCTLDIIAHEWTHAVTEHTANLIYADESGALNESMSDVFAALIDGDWLQGEDNWLKATAPAGRNLADPTNGGQYDPANPIDSVIDGHQPDHTDDQYTGPADRGGVHINSGIMNKAFYLIVTGGTHRDIRVCTGLGREVAGHLYYKALTALLVQSSDFAAMRDAVLDALEDLYEHDPRYERWEASIINAFAAVGVGSAVPCPLICWIAPRICPPFPDICVVAPRICPPFPDICVVAPRICPPSPDICVVAPGTCPPSPDVCVVAPGICPPQPDGGCLPGPDPIPFQPKMEPRKTDEPE